MQYNAIQYNTIPYHTIQYDTISANVPSRHQWSVSNAFWVCHLPSWKVLSREHRSRCSGILRSPRVICFAYVSNCCLDCFLDSMFLHCVAQRVPKGFPLKTISGHFGNTGGNLKMMVSYRRNHHCHGRRVPRDPRSLQKSASKKRREQTLNNDNSSGKWVLRGSPLGDRKASNEPTFS